MQTKIVVYSSAWCGFCRAAKQLLQSKNLAFEEILLDKQPELRQQVMQRSGQRTVPQIWIGETHVGGYTDLLALETSGGLADLLTPG
ncbi:MAG: glutaredoxin 3 [Gammaproteobacteria bacterium]|nr:glutaredoxin 3 [Gammaproteobacteria bacterium]MBT8151333.1 glutaredoxin 3 [Gammaproteobacteria bacterium]NND39967.1 glutaredoxin 3 [Pseudomonadales bacterium]NNL11598.1 glutaredoxin 3 [Pseudomonadales bacterium]NNM11004.1 glutaredoxin 3 [Pseudomonadales bacterium]